jgi:DNA-binding response OmpR family regulator
MDSTISILVVDDEPDLLDNIGLALEAENYHVLLANNGSEALRILQAEPVSLILADIAMPDMNGYQLYEQVRQNSEWVLIPFIFLTARTMDSDIRYGKELGVDDYLTKPIRTRDLLAAIKGKLHRTQQIMESAVQTSPEKTAEAQVPTCGPLRIDSKQHRVWLDDQELNLSAREFILLEYLMQQAGNVISPQELIQITHKFEADHVEAGTLLRPLILALRRKLDLKPGQPGSIENVRGVGYRLVTPNK